VRRAPLRLVTGGLLLVLPLSGCSSDGDDQPSAAVVSAPVPGITLPPDPLRELVPTPAEAPAGMTPLLTATGRRDLAAIAAFSADPAAAGRALKANGFSSAYAVQYAHPTDGRVLSVVAVRFSTVKGATADLTADLAAAGGTKVAVEKVGDQSAASTQPLPERGGQLLTLRFRSGPTTWLVAYVARPTADPAVAVRIAKALVARATD
jgi:hypothetical protein